MPSYYFRIKVSNTGLLDQNENITLLFSFLSEELYELQQVMMTATEKRKLISFTSTRKESNQLFFFMILFSYR